MEGWNLSHCDINEKKPECGYFDVVANCILSKPFKNSTYKYCFVISLLTLIFENKDKTVFSFSEIGDKFSQSYWNIEVLLSLPQKTKQKNDSGSSIEQIVKKYILKYFSAVDVPLFNDIPNLIKSEYLNESNKIFSKYVIGAFCGETSCYIYGFDKKNRTINLNPDAISVLINYKDIFIQLAFYEWIKKTERIMVNDESGDNGPISTFEKSFIL